MVLAFRAFQAALNSALAVSRSLAAHGESAGEVDNDVPEPDDPVDGGNSNGQRD